jgi:hypothetical protein
MPQLGSSGSVRGTANNGCSYREHTYLPIISAEEKSRNKSLLDILASSYVPIGSASSHWPA